MISRKDFEAQIPHCIDSVDFPELGKKISGKVRDSYVTQNADGRGRRILITSDRLSAFDVNLTTLPFKGEILNSMAAYWFEETKHLVENHIIAKPHPNVFVCEELEIIPIEVVVRGYLAGSAWRDHQAGRAVSGIEIPKSMKKSERFESPILTPSTKAEKGEHDTPISREEILRKSFVEETLWSQIEETALAVFAHGQKKAEERGLLLVDTKYEFGLKRDEKENHTLVLADEIHTPDSSRYWIADSYQVRVKAGEDPEMLDKEFVRRWLIEMGFMGDGKPPVFTDEFRVETSMRYAEVFERVTGENFAAKPGSTLAAIRELIPEILELAQS